MKIRAFHALRPAADLVEKIAAVPYDVVNTEEARKMAEGNPLSFLHVSRPEVDFPENQNPYATEVYEHAAAVLKKEENDGTFVREKEPSLYLYRQIMGNHSQAGLVTCCHIDDYVANVIKKHEKTRQDKEDDRTKHCQIVGAHTGPVFLTYKPKTEITAKMEELMRGNALTDFKAEDGIRHTVWKISEDLSWWISSFAAIDTAYIADGHHRAAASARTGLERRAMEAKADVNASYNWFLAVLFPSDQLRILPYNRCVADLNGLSREEFLAKVSEKFNVVATENGVVDEAGTCAMYLSGQWYRLSWKIPHGDPVGSLDVSVLQQQLLDPILGIDDPRTNTRISFIGGIRGNEELEKRVDSKQDAVAFAMVGVDVLQMMAIADAGQVMPPKSTWFEPKLRSGLLVHTLDD